MALNKIDFMSELSEEKIKSIVKTEIENAVNKLKVSVKIDNAGEISAVKPDKDLMKFMYDKNYEELKLAREWSIKISAFTSAVYFGVITLANSDAG
jgi:hypothetical protein